MVGVFVLVGMQELQMLENLVPVYLKRTHEKTLKLVSMEVLKKNAIDLS